MQLLGEHELDERSLIFAARQGSQEAWERLVQSHQTAVFRLAYLILGDSDAAEDVAQETFVRAMKALNRFDPERPLRPWLLSIVRNTSRNWWRSLGRRWAAWNRLVQETGSEKPSGGQVEGQVERQERSRQVWQAVKDLNPVDEEVIYLRYFMELSVAETAQSLGIAEGTVKSRLHRALGRLREKIQHEYPELMERLQNG